MHFIDESFWIAVCFVIFVYLSYQPIRKAILKAIDTKIVEVKSALQETEKLKDDAKILLQDVEQRLNNFDNLKEHTVLQARVSTAQLIESRGRELESMLNWQKESAIIALESQKKKVLKELEAEFLADVKKLVTSYMRETGNNSISDKDIAMILLNSKKL